ncbi:MAG: ThuA domain-containing protein, partial [Verrucomicrobiales bacterium]
RIAGGAAPGHDKLGPFGIEVLDKNHPIMKGVPAHFGVVDELYHVNAGDIPEGTSSITVLAQTSPSLKYNTPHPSVWITGHPKARLVGIAPGHDERVHGLPAYRAILVNAVKWVAGE